MIRTLIYRILKILYKINIISDIWEINYKGKIFSLNDLYKQGHWSVRSKLKNKYKDIFIKLFKEAKVQKCKQFYIIIFYNTRHDTDNIVGVAKVLVDTMKDVLIPDDDKRYYRGLSIFPDESLEPKSLKILIIKKNVSGKKD